MGSKSDFLLITYSPEIKDGVPLYVSSNCLPVKASKYEPAGHSFHAVALKLRGLDEKEEAETDDRSVSSDDKSQDFSAGSDNFSSKGKKKSGSGSQQQDHYALLGLGNLRFLATEDQIRKSYRDMALKHHPDKQAALLLHETTEAGKQAKKDEIESHFKAIQEAYEVLMDPTKRRIFDSTDEFDDDIPTDCAPQDFFKKLQDAEAARAAEEERKRKEEEAKIAAAAALNQKKLKEKEKKLLRKEKSRLRALAAPVVADNHFGLSEDDVETACTSLDMEQLKNLCDSMEDKDTEEKARLLRGALNKEESSSNASKGPKIHANGVQGSAPKSTVPQGITLSNYEKKERPWGKEEIELLRKAIQKFPKGTSRRWEVVSDFIGTSRSVEEILKATKTVLLQKPDSSKAFDSFLEKRKAAPSIVSPLSTRDDPAAVPTAGAGAESSKGAAQPTASSSQAPNEKTGAAPVPDEAPSATPSAAPSATPSATDPDAWSEAQVLALVQALKAFPKDANQRWERVAAAVPGKTMASCKKKVQSMRSNFRTKKGAE
ncbi:unnamed protein product [Alopecurus aequalis]